MGRKKGRQIGENLYGIKKGNENGGEATQGRVVERKSKNKEGKGG